MADKSDAQIKALAKLLGTSEADVRAAFSGSSNTAPTTGAASIAAQSPFFGTDIYMQRSPLDVVNEFNSISQKTGDLSYRASNGDLSAAVELQANYAQLRDLKGQLKSKTPTGYTSQKYEQAILAPLSWDSATIKQFVNSGVLRGINGFQPGMGMPDIMSKWQDMVTDAATLSQGGKKYSPWDVMSTFGQKGKFGTITKDGWQFDLSTGERIKYVGPTSKTSTSKQVDISSPEQAQALITQTLREAIGRAPTDKELAKFKASVAGYEHGHPQVTTTTQTVSGDQIAKAQANNSDIDWSAANSSSTTTGGVSDAARAALITTPIQKTDEYGKYQAATTYWGAMMQMLGGG